MTYALDATPYLSRPTRSLARLRADLLDQIEDIERAMAALIYRRLSEYGIASEFIAGMRQLDRESDALQRRLRIVEHEMEIGRRG